jgi:cell division protein FtsW
MERRQGKRTEKTRRYYDYSLLFIIIFLSCFGLIMIYSSSAYVAEMKFSDGSIHFLKRQALISAASFVVMLAISKMNYHFFAKFAVLGYGAAVLCMILVNFTPLGIERNGQKRWLGVSESLSFQPTELVKVAVILALACLIVLYVKRKKMDEWGTIFLMVFVTAVPGLLVLMNNLSSGIIILGIGFTMVFVASRKKLRFAVVVGLGVVAVVAALQLGDKLVEMGVLESYQLDRIHVWRSPESYPLEGGYQVLQGLYAIGSGGIFGKGLGNSIQKLSFVPEAQNDMIFSIICEELGLFGAACLILLFLFMIWRFMVIANNAPDLLGSMIVVGVMAHIAIQVILNIAVITNTIPNTGITLPFISYGGTSVLFLMVEMGMVLSVSNQIKIEK